MSQLSLERLTSLGLTTYEAKAYLALIRRDSLAAADVARLAALPRQRVYDVLASLVEKGLANARGGNPAVYAAHRPEAAIRRLVATRREQLEALERDAEAVIEELTPAYREGLTQRERLEYIEVLRGARVIGDRFDELQHAVDREILIFTKAPYAIRPEDNVEGMRLLATRSARAVYEYSVFEDPADVAAVRRFLAAGEEARFVPELPLKLAIFDDKTVLFAMEDPIAGEAEFTIVVVEHAALASVLKLAFYAIWERGLTFEEACDLLAAA